MFQAHIFLPLTVALGASRLVGDRKRQQQQQLEGHHGGQYYGNLDAEPPVNNNNNNNNNNSTGAVTPLVVDLDVQCCVDALRKSQCFNQLARDYLVVFESREFVFGGCGGVGGVV